MIIIVKDNLTARTNFISHHEIKCSTLKEGVGELFNRYPQLYAFFMGKDQEEAKKTSYRLNGEMLYDVACLDLPVKGEDVLEIAQDIPSGENSGAMAGAGFAFAALMWWNPAGWAALGASVTTTVAGVATTAYTMTTLGASLMMMGMSMALGGIASLIQGQPTIPDAGGNTSAPTYSFSGIRNTTAPGTPLNIVYGTHRVGGHILNVFTSNVGTTENYLNAQIALCEGEIKSVEADSIRINDLSFRHYPDVSVYQRLGTKDQLGAKPIVVDDEEVNFFDINDIALSKSVQGSYSFNVDYPSTAVEVVAYNSTSRSIMGSGNLIAKFSITYYPDGINGAPYTEYGAPIVIKSKKKLTQRILLTKAGNGYTGPVIIKDEAYKRAFNLAVTLRGYNLVNTGRSSKDAEDYMAGFNRTENSYTSGLEIPEAGIIVPTESEVDLVRLNVSAPVLFRNTTDSPNPLTARVDFGVLYRSIDQATPSATSITASGTNKKKEVTVSSVEGLERGLEISFAAISGKTFTILDVNTTTKKVTLNTALTATITNSVITLTSWKEHLCTDSGSVGGSWYIVGKSKSEVFAKIDELQFPEIAKYEIRIVRRTPDHTGDFKINDKISLKDITEIVQDKFIYPHTAMLGYRIRATEQLSGGMPTFSAVVNGTKVALPTGYNPFLKEYPEDRGQTWDGTMTWDEDTYTGTKEWTDNPVWCLYDLLTNKRYGLGYYLRISPAKKQEMLRNFYQMARYCDEYIAQDGTVVSRDTEGATPRYTLNIVIDSGKTAAEWCTTIAAAMCGTLYYANGIIYLDIEREKPMVQLFNMTQVKDYKQSALSQKSAPNVLEVQFPNIKKNYTLDVFLVESEAKKANPYLEEYRKTVNLIGVPDETQCLRLARYMLLAGGNTTHVAFKTGTTGLRCTVGDVIGIQHDVPQYGQGGRVVAVNGRSLTLSTPVDMTSEGPWLIKLQNTVGDFTTDLIDGQLVENQGTFTTVTLTGDPSTPISEGAVFSIGKTEVKPFRVTKLDRDTDELVSIDCIEYNSSIFQVANDLTNKWGVSYTKYSEIEAADEVSVTDVKVTESYRIEQDGTVTNLIETYFAPPVNEMKWKGAVVRYADLGGSAIKAEVTTGDSTVYVEDASDFIEKDRAFIYDADGSQEEIEYAGVDLQTNTITGVTKADGTPILGHPVGSGITTHAKGSVNYQMVIAEDGRATITGVSINRVYEVKVCSQYKDGTYQSVTEAPTVVVAVLGKRNPPAQVEETSIVTAQDTSLGMVVSFDKVNNADVIGYEIALVNQSNSVVTVINNLSVSTLKVPVGFLTAGSYVIRVIAVDSTKNRSNPSYSQIFSPTLPATPAPTLINDGRSLLVKWPEVISYFPISSYRVYVSSSSGFTPDDLTNLTFNGFATSAKISGTVGQTYYVKVVAEDKAGNRSAASAQVSAMITDTAGIVSALTNDTHTVPADSNGNVTSFNGATSTMSVYLGTTDDSGNWSFTVTKSGVTCAEAITSRTQTITAMSADTGYVEWAATRAGYPTQTRRFTVTKNKAGANGSAGAAGQNATSYWLVTSTAAIKQAADYSYNPGSLVIVGMSQVGTGVPAAYNCRYKIYENGSATPSYTSTIDEGQRSYFPSNIACTSIKVEMYMAGGTTTKLDEQTIPVVSDGAGLPSIPNDAELFAFTKNLTGSKGTAPGAGAVYTRRYLEGVFGDSCIALDYNSGNIYADGSYESGVAHPVSGGATWDATQVDPTGRKPGTKVLKVTGAAGWFGRDIAVVNGVTYTASAYCYVSQDFDGNSAEVVGESNIGSASNVITYDHSRRGTWQRIGFTFVANGPTARILAYHNRLGGTTTKGYALFDDMQVEQKGWATSYTSLTNRPLGVITYPGLENQINWSKWGMLVWIKRAVLGSFSPISGTWPRHYFALESDGKLMYSFINSSGAQEVVYSTYIVNDTSWHLVGVTVDASTNKIMFFKDANYSEHTKTITLSAAPPPTFAVGRYDFSDNLYSANMLMGNMVVFKNSVVPYLLPSIAYSTKKPFYEPAPLVNVPSPSGVSVSFS